jgi:hypothetical protein
MRKRFVLRFVLYDKVPKLDRILNIEYFGRLNNMNILAKSTKWICDGAINISLTSFTRA